MSVRLTAVLYLVAFAASGSVQLVSTSQGAIYGNDSIPGIHQFLGIRYAAPPIGKLRFANPIPYLAFEKQTFYATEYGPGCLQNSDPSSSAGFSEDCLRLNVIRPLEVDHLGETQLPVMVWIHGGSHVNGESSWFHGISIVQQSIKIEKPVIFVSLNYRVGGFGWLYNSAFASRDLLNLGLKDQRLALQWVQENIAAFGGDPAKVIVFGQSSGSFDVWMQMHYATLTESDERLFRGAILMSGAPPSASLKAHYPSEGDSFYQETLENVGCLNASEPLECLRGLPAIVISNVWLNESSSLYRTVYQYSIDNDWITTPDYWTEEVLAIPLIGGQVLNEGSLAVPSDTAIDFDFLSGSFAANFNITDFDLVAALVTTYYNHTAAENGRGVLADPMLSSSYYVGEAALGDAIINFGMRVLLSNHSTIAPTWGYQFRQRPPLGVFAEPFYPVGLSDATENRLGVLHESDLAFVFGDVYQYTDRTQGDTAVANLIQERWILFASTLDPNTYCDGSAPEWKKYEAQKAQLFVFEEQGPFTSRMHPDNMRLDSFEAYRAVAMEVGWLPLPNVEV